jgi:predicted nucleic acid-binding protein
LSIFVDTSALVAVLDADDANHAEARRTWERLVLQEESLVSTNYVLVETFALAQRRLGIGATRDLADDVIPLLSISWVDEDAHRAGVSATLAASRRRLSLVDCVSFETMRRLGVKSAFAFDRHFEEQGFACLP